MSNFLILDRDGVINEDSDSFIKSVDELQLIPGSIDAIARLTAGGYRIFVASNQSGIARGLLDEYALAKIHQRLNAMIEDVGGFIEGWVYCPHGPVDGCDCRKPKPGLFLQIANRFDVQLDQVSAIGDSERDLAAAAAAGCRPILVRTGKGQKTETQATLPPGTIIFDHLLGMSLPRSPWGW